MPAELSVNPRLSFDLPLALEPPICQPCWDQDSCAALQAMDSQCLQRLTARFDLDLHPSKVQDVETGVKEQLNSQLLSYNDDLDGVLMSYSNLKVLNKQASVHPYFPYFHVTATAEALVFRPSPGATLVGKVIKIGVDYVGLLVLGIFNASIAAEHVRKEFRCNVQEQTWSSMKKPQHVIEVGSEVRFKVIKWQEQGGFIGISGSLQDPETGSTDFLGLQQPSVSKKKDGNANGVGTAANGGHLSNDILQSTKKQKDHLKAGDEGAGPSTKGDKGKRRGELQGKEEADQVQEKSRKDKSKKKRKAEDSSPGKADEDDVGRSKKDKSKMKKQKTAA